ncbi:Txe/YoeB family addiction module toxin [Nostoc sphaeroides CHAB 2801]|uniref:Txe/YoeB family addiction module toxin n=1 Tax=Nostoc sphaeroides TaxID=446679 RepID=UPI000E4C6426|nr:Txe/YoeB family addiction module toxin [Nostoc sphaeroides]MCC5629201.1 Txe/YoeB family addiction module toxin [Nostoc sphaeroides CHAB 2801]
MSDNLEPEALPQSEVSQEDNLERNLVFDRRFLEDLTYWVETNRKTALRVLSLVEEIRRNPFQGTGNPERLRYYDANIWSRRITQTDRIVYVVSDDRVEFIQARYHYGDR